MKLAQKAIYTTGGGNISLYLVNLTNNLLGEKIS